MVILNVERCEMISTIIMGIWHGLVRRSTRIDGQIGEFLVETPLVDGQKPGTLQRRVSGRP